MSLILMSSPSVPLFLVAIHGLWILKNCAVMSKAFKDL